jgi:hypothetical protein
MKALARRAGVLTLLGLFLLVPGLAAVGECASYISSGSSDEPLTGELTGQRMVTVTSAMTLTSSLSSKLLGGSYSLSRTTTTTYYVGTYVMSDGTTRQVRCDTYRYA